MTDLKTFNELERENSQLKKTLANEILKIWVLEETLKKVVSAAAKRHAVQKVVKKWVCSVRGTCRYMGFHRSTCQYHPQKTKARDKQMVRGIVRLSRKYPRYSYGRIWGCRSDNDGKRVLNW